MLRDASGASRNVLYLCIALICCVSCSISHNLVTEDIPDFLLCRGCGAGVANASLLHTRFSPTALVYGNQSLFGRRSVEVQLLENPLGIRFQVITVSRASCVGVDQWHSEHSWFPGYAWKHCLCLHCGHHIGWMFEPLASAVRERKVPSNKGFYALILDSILLFGVDSCRFPADHLQVLQKLIVAETAASSAFCVDDKSDTSMTAEENSGAKEAQQAAKVVLTDEQKHFLANCEAEFSNRYTDDDPEFIKYRKNPCPPPIVDPWYNKPKRNFDWSGRSSGGRRQQSWGSRNDKGGGGGGGGGGYQRHNERYYGHRQRPY